MDAQINFAGLCSFLNLDRGNSEMPEPSVILVRGDGESQAVTETQVSSKQQTPKADADQQPAGPTQSATLRGQWTVDAATPMTTLEINASVKISFAGAPPDGDSAAFDPKARRALRAGDSGEPLPDAPPAPPPEPPPVAFVAFDSSKVRVSDTTGFLQVPDAPGFLYRALDGVELAITSDPPGQPTVDSSYALVAKKDLFWPDAQHRWDRDYVPRPRPSQPSEQPKKEKVAVFMRFGSGKIAAGRRTSKKWCFPINNDPNQGFYPSAAGESFAREVIYSEIPNQGTLQLAIADIESGQPITTLDFTLGTGTSMTLFIGNLEPSYIANFVAGTLSKAPVTGEHFKDLNRIAGMGNGPIPVVAPQPQPQPQPGQELPGGGEDGYCGPDNGNGGHP